MANIVYIAISIDGYISDKDNKLDWLNDIPNPENIDCGFANFIERIDAIVMGRNTFETVIGFGCEWPYKKPVFVLSHSLQTIPQTLQDKVQLLQGSPVEIIKFLNQKGYHELYIDGGKTVQNFLKQNLIDELVITTIPILLGGGTPLFDILDSRINFRLLQNHTFLNALVQSHYQKITA